jgi:outer membrane receptor protein involved in Fe transport
LTYQIVGQGHLGQALGNITNTSVPNQNLVAFNKTEVELGLDARLFDNRLSLDLAYYKNETTNDIVPVAASVFSGYSSAIANIGIVENKGFEFLISGKPIITDNFSWNTSFNGSYNTGTVIATNETDGNISVGQPRSLNIAVTPVSSFVR